MTLADSIVNVDPVACVFPVPPSAVFQLANESPARTRLPVLPNTVTVAPCWYDVESVGLDPDDALVAS